MKSPFSSPSIGIIAPSAAVPASEFRLGLEKIKDAGFDVRVHPQVLKRHRYFAGDDQLRAKALLEYAFDPTIDAIWCARGGYGALRVIREIEAMKLRKLPPRKLLMGYSDTTILHEYVRQKWNWRTLHAPMPGLRQFWTLRDSDWRELQQILDGEIPRGLQSQRIREISIAHGSRRRTLRGELIGGNLSVWNLMLQTPLMPNPKGKILFFEDIDEYLYRMDRMVQSLAFAGGFRGASAIVLGTFARCEDSIAKVLKKFPEPGLRDRERRIREPEPRELVPLRARLSSRVEIRRIFTEAAAQWKVPIFEGLPVGHGPEKRPLPLGARYEIRGGHLMLKRWD